MKKLVLGCVSVAMLASLQPVYAEDVESGGSQVGDKVVATSKGLTLTTSDLNTKIDDIQAQKFHSRDPDLQTLNLLAEEMMLDRILARMAREKGLENDPEVQARIGLAVEHVLANAVINDHISDSDPKTAEILAREIYIANKNRYDIPEAVDVSHVLIKSDGRTREEAKARAEEVLEKVKADPGSFAALAREYSEDRGSAIRGGSLGMTARGKFVKPFEDAAFAMQTSGEISGLVESEFGFHILQFHSRREPRKIDFEDIKDALIVENMGVIKKTQKASFLREVIESNEVAYDVDAMRRLLERREDERKSEE
ncbi:MAG: peptidylprolyl isomerase [Chromatiales bacterium]|nr:peptidylprolyl isomerase [Chromatiales bacterium]